MKTSDMWLLYTTFHRCKEFRSTVLEWISALCRTCVYTNRLWAPIGGACAKAICESGVHISEAGLIMQRLAR